MKTVAGMCAAALLAAPVLAADPPGFALWRASDLKSHDAALSIQERARSGARLPPAMAIRSRLRGLPISGCRLSAVE